VAAPKPENPEFKSEPKDTASETAANSAVSEGAPLASDDDSPLEDTVRKLTAEKEELRDTLLRRQADFENYRKRVEKERHQERHRGVENLVEQLLPVLDAFDNALAAAKESGDSEYLKGFELIRRQLWDALSKQGLARIEAVGKEFNPHFHHAIASVETTEQADGTVVGELQPGYTFHERVLRPAMVRVAAEPGSAHSKHQN
jgi:molecular chaperone GrpE